MSEPLFANRFIVYTGDVSSLSNARLGLPKLGAPLRAPKAQTEVEAPSRRLGSVDRGVFGLDQTRSIICPEAA